MAWVLIAVAALVVVVIGLVAVGTTLGRLEAEPPRNVYEVAESVEFVASALPDDLTAELSYDDVSRVLRLHLDFLHEAGVARSGGDLVPEDEITVVDPEDAAGYIVWRAGLVDFRPAPDAVAAIVAAHLAYFEAIGAVAPVPGPEVDALGLPDRPGRTEGA